MKILIDAMKRLLNGQPMVLPEPIQAKVVKYDAYDWSFIDWSRYQ